MTTPALRVLSLIPPMTQLNTPYPSTAYITGFLRSRGVDAVQADLALALVLKLFSPAGLESVRSHALAQAEADRTASVHAFLDQFALCRSTINPVIAFLQGRDSTLAHRIAARGLLQNLIVRPGPKGKFAVEAGERRRRHARSARCASLRRSARRHRRSRWGAGNGSWLNPAGVQETGDLRHPGRDWAPGCG